MKRVLFLALLVYGLILGALSFFEGRLLLLAIPLLVFITAGVLTLPGQPDIAAHRSVAADRSGENVPVTVALTITNNGGSIHDILIEDGTAATLEITDGEQHVLTKLGAGQSLQLVYTVQGKRGYHHFSDAAVTISDRLGLFRQKARVKTGGATQIVVLPNISRTRPIRIHPRRTRVYAGSVPARIGGTGTEFFGVREYQPSDAMRHINWRANARHPGQLFTNEYEQERIADVGLILDARQRLNLTRQNESLFEYSVVAAATLAEAFIREGHRVGLLRYGQLLEWTSPGYGKIQRERILQSLAKARTGESQVFENIRNLPTRYFPLKSQLVMISPLCVDDPEFLIRIRAQGYELMVFSPNPVKFEAQTMKSDAAALAAVRIATIERRQIFRRLRQSGVRAIDWDVSQPLQHVISTSLSRQPAQAPPVFRI